MKKVINKFKSRTFRIVSGLISLVVIASISYFIFLTTTDRVHIDNSLIQAPIITISPSTSGKVLEIDAKEGQTVQVGDTLAIVGSETLRADTDGLVVSASDLTGSSVTTQTPLVQMIRPVSLRVAGTIDENKGLNNLRIGQVISFTIDALPGNTYWGYVDEISPTAKTAAFSFSTSSERVTQQFTVYAKFNTSKYPDIKNGMSAKMVVFTRTK